MARNEVISRQMLPEAVGDVSMSDSHDVHVLAVDDSLIDRTVIERLLKITSCKVTAVDSGRRALQFLGLGDDKSSVGFNGLKVDMIITDYCMPGMTGYELLKKVKESSDFREIPVVIMSSENIVARIDRCLEEGAEDFIVKPVKLSDVKRLKDYMFGEDGIVRENLGARGIINKRKLEQISDDPYDSSSSPQFVSSPSSSRQSDSAPSSLQSDSAPSSPQSNSSPSSSSLLELTPSSSPLNSPSPLESPTRRLKMTNCD